MNWATLPEGCPDVRIRHAAVAQNIYDEFDDDSTDRLMRICDLGKVCSQWKRAILSSGDLFKSPDEYTSSNLSMIGKDGVGKNWSVTAT